MIVSVVYLKKENQFLLLEPTTFCPLGKKPSKTSLL